MRLSMRDKRRSPSRYGVRVTDIEGQVVDFKTPQDAANALEVTRQALYQALKNGWNVRGCRIEKTVGEN